MHGAHGHHPHTTHTTHTSHASHAATIAHTGRRRDAAHVPVAHAIAAAVGVSEIEDFVAVAAAHSVASAHPVGVVVGQSRHCAIAVSQVRLTCE